MAGQSAAPVRRFRPLHRTSATDITSDRYPGPRSEVPEPGLGRARPHMIARIVTVVHVVEVSSA